MASGATVESLTIKLATRTRVALDEFARTAERDRDAVLSDAVVAYLDVQRLHGELIQARMMAEAEDFALDAEVEAAYDAFR